MDFIERLKQLLDQRSWTPYKLSIESGISVKTIYQWLDGDYMPSVRNLYVVCDALKVTMSEFFCGGELIEVTDEVKELYQAWKALSKEKQSAIRALISNNN